MINILPEQGKRTVLWRYRLRLAALSLIALSGALLIMGGLLSFGYLNGLAREDAARQEAEALESAEAQGEELELPIIAAREELEAYEPLLRERAAGSRIGSVLGAKTSGIALSLISYERSDKVMRLSGVAAARSDLLAFERSLRRVPGVSEVALPVGDLARSVNAPFSITVRFSEEL